MLSLREVNSYLLQLFTFILKNEAGCFMAAPWTQTLWPIVYTSLHKHLQSVFGMKCLSYLWVWDTGSPIQVVCKPWVLSVSSTALVPIAAILITDIWTRTRHAKARRGRTYGTFVHSLALTEAPNRPNI